ncbi:hypothetical protein USDA257_c28270 [Sinorhizobium fredii USDA 257]|uniref:Lectin-like protein BA14k n=1 Tax=Sinorhizobium fredii (strain USDA 257) TaxID=1185652 RepID=I3X692_SINF2|nr:hypothetical protein USDA257_c28270 [Sinorhizobium fredii USDA 257]
MRSTSNPLGAGLAIAGAIASPPRRVYSDASSAHVEWCYASYRSYRAYDNTFQPYYGPRQECISPYYLIRAQSIQL